MIARLIAALLLACATAMAERPSKFYSADSNIDGDQFEINSQAWSNPRLVFSLYESTTSYSNKWNATGWTMYLKWAPSSSDALMYSIQSSSTSNGFAEFLVSSNQFGQTCSKWYCALIASSGTVNTVFAEGLMTLTLNPGVTGGQRIARLASVDWTQFSYLNTSNAGPYRFAAAYAVTTNADGSISVPAPTASAVAFANITGDAQDNASLSNALAGKLTEATSLGATNVTGGILTFANRMVGLTASAITNGLGGSGITANDVTNSLDLSVAPSLTGTVALAASALPSSKTNGWETGSHAGFLTNTACIWSGAVSADYANPLNWFGGRVPGRSDVALFDKDLAPAGAYFMSGTNRAGLSIYRHLSANFGVVFGDVIIEGGSGQWGTINGAVLIDGGTHNGGTINGDVIFRSGSFCWANVNGNVTAYDSWIESGTIDGNVTLFGSSTLDATVKGRVITSSIEKWPDGSLFLSKTNRQVVASQLIALDGIYGSASGMSGCPGGAVATDDVRYLASLTNRTYVTPAVIDCSPTTTITRVMIDAAPWGEMSLSLTQACYLTLDATVTNTADAATFALYITGTNALTWNTNQLTGTAWTNAPPCDRIFRKPARAGAVAIW